LIHTEGTWVDLFWGEMDKLQNEEVIRLILCRMMNRTEERKYKTEKADYEVKLDDLRQDEMYLQRIEAKKKSEAKKAFRKMLTGRSKVAKAYKASKKAGLAKALPKRPVIKPAAKHVSNLISATVASMKRAPVSRAAKPQRPPQKGEQKKVI